jgi:nucleoside-specific channel-forming protein
MRRLPGNFPGQPKNSGEMMKKMMLAAGAAVALSCSFSANAADGNSEYLSDWWHQSVNVVGSYHTRFGPQLRNDTYLEYEAFAKKDWFDFYGYIDAPRFFGGDGSSTGIWNHGSPLFMEIEPRFSIDKLSGLDLSVGPFKEWYFANNYIYDMGRNSDNRQNTWYMGLGTDVETGLPMSLSLNVYAKYQWENYGAANEDSWDGYRFKIKYFVPITDLWGGKLSYIGFTNFDWGSDLGDEPNRTSNSIASSHILALNYDHWHYSFVARYFHNGGQWQDGPEMNFGKGDFRVRSTGWGYYLVAGYNF